MTKKAAYLGSASVIIGVLALSSPAAAQSTERLASANSGTVLPEVVVTAERRDSTVQRTPAAVTVRSGGDLLSEGRSSTYQILEDFPGVVALDNDSLNVGSSDVQGNNISIRGITPGSSAGSTQVSATPATAVYVDGVYEGVGSGYDLDRVEVLRGPQGTLYGRSATAGVVSFYTRNPEMDNFGANGAVEIGNYDLRHFTAAVNIPLAQGLAARVSGDYRDQDKGYFNDADRGVRERTNARAKLLWEPNDALSILLGYAYEKDIANSGGDDRQALPPSLAIRTTNSALYPGFKESRQYWMEANWELGPVRLTYLPAFRTWEQDDFFVRTNNFISSGASLRQAIQTPTDEFMTHELRIASNTDSSVKWLAGLFYYNNKLRSSNFTYLGGAGGAQIAVLSETRSNRDTENLGFFGETTFPVTSAMRVTLGARYDETTVLVSDYLQDNPFGLCGTAVQFTVPLPPGARCLGPGQANIPVPPGTTITGVEVPFHNFNYKVRLEYDLTPDNMAYAMISTGFRPGDAGIANRAVNILDAEKLTSYEFGSKNRFFDNALQLNLALYYYQYRGFQTGYRPDTPNPQDFAGFVTATPVTVPANNIGGELEILYQFTSQDRLGLNYNYVRSRWEDKPAGFAQAQIEDERALTPHTLTANYQHIFNLPGNSTFAARIDAKYESAHRTQNLHVDFLRLGFDQYVQVDARTVGNLTGTWVSDGGRYSISAYVRNFTDEKYTTYEVQGDPTAINLNWSDPRTFGVVLSANF